MKITIGGKPGSGKTSTGKLVAARLGYKFYSVGDLRGKAAMEKGLTIDEFNRLAEKDRRADTDFDDQARKIGETEDNFVMDSWLAFRFIPDSVKIFLDVSPGEAARRIFKDQRADEPRKESVGEIRRMLEDRLARDRERWKKLYGIDYLDRKNYDLVIDTTGLKKEQVVRKILDFIKKKSA